MTTSKPQVKTPLTPLEEVAMREKLQVRISELELELEQREILEAEDSLLRGKIKTYEYEIKKRNDKLSKLMQKLEGYKQNEKFRDVGMQYMIDLKAEIRGLAIQCGENETEADDSFLSRQLSFCGPVELDYLKGLKRRLKERRHGMFLLGSIDPDSASDSKDKQYKLGKSIGKNSVIPVH